MRRFCTDNWQKGAAVEFAGNASVQHRLGVGNVRGRDATSQMVRRSCPVKMLSSIQRALMNEDHDSGEACRVTRAFAKFKQIALFLTILHIIV